MTYWAIDEWQVSGAKARRWFERENVGTEVPTYQVPAYHDRTGYWAID